MDESTMKLLSSLRWMDLQGKKERDRGYQCKVGPNRRVGSMTREEECKRLSYVKGLT